MQNHLELKLGEVAQNHLENNQEIENVFEEMSEKFINLEKSIKKIMQNGDIPHIISLSNYAGKERSDGEAGLVNKVDALQTELNKTQGQTMISIYKALKNIEGVKVFNI